MRRTQWLAWYAHASISVTKGEPMSRREERQRGSARLVPLHADDGSFDREFWATVPPAARLELVWDMVLEFLSWRGLDGDQSRLQRSVCRIERGKG